ncbi:MAG: YfhO family protein [Chloroflexota bacterium]
MNSALAPGDVISAESSAGSRLRDLSLDALAGLVLLGAVGMAFREPLQQLHMILVGYDLVQSYNWESVNRWALQKGQLPFWNPFIFAGFPALADIQTHVLYPPAVLLRWLPIPAFYTILLAGHLAIAGLGTYALCRVVGAARLPSIIGALGFMLGGVFAPRVDAGHVSLISVWSWFPVGLCLAVAVGRGRSWWPVAGLGVVLALQLLAGHPQSTLYTFSATALSVLVSAFGAWRQACRLQRPVLLIARGVAAFVIGFGLSAVQLLPTTVLLGEIGRSEGFTFDASARNSMGLEQLLTLVFPNAFPSLTPDPNEDFRGKYWEQSSYAGLVVTMLAPLAVLHRHSRWTLAYLALLALLSLGFAAGKYLPFFSLHYMLFPNLRQASRILPLWSVAVSVLGAVGLTQLSRSRGGFSRVTGYALVTAGVIIALALLPLLPTAVRSPGDAYGRSFGFVIVPLILIGLLALFARRRNVNLALLFLLTLTAAVDMVTYASAFVHVTDPIDRRADRMDAARLLNGVRTGRVISLCEGKVPANDLMFLGVPTVDGYNSFFLASYARYGFLVRDNVADAITKQAPRFWPAPALPARPDLLRLANVTHLLGCELPVPAGFDLVRERRGSLLMAERQPLSRALWMCRTEAASSREDAIQRLQRSDLDVRSTVVLQSSGATAAPEGELCQRDAKLDIGALDQPDGLVRVRVSAPESGMLYLSEPYYSERRAFVDGREVAPFRANLAFTAIPVEAGEHEVELRIVPSMFLLGVVTSIGTLLLTVIGLVFGQLRGRADTNDSAFRSS